MADVTIIVEGTAHVWSKPTISYAEIVTLEVPDYSQNPQTKYTVTFENGPGVTREGGVAEGQSVGVKEGMIFNVSDTGQS